MDGGGAGRAHWLQASGTAPSSVLTWLRGEGHEQVHTHPQRLHPAPWGTRTAVGRGTASRTRAVGLFPTQPALSARLTFANLKCRTTRNKLTPHLAEQNAKQADKCSAFQKVIVHFVNQIDFQILKPFFLKEVTEQAWEGAESRTVCHPSDGSGVVLTRTQADPSCPRPHLSQPMGDPSPTLLPRKSP